MLSTEDMWALLNETATSRLNRHAKKQTPRPTAPERLRQRADKDPWVEPICDILEKHKLLVTDINRPHETNLRIRFKDPSDPSSPLITLIANQSGDFSLFPDLSLASADNTPCSIAARNIKDYIRNIHEIHSLSHAFGLPLGIAHKLYIAPNLFLLAKSVLRCKDALGLDLKVQSVAINRHNAEIFFVSPKIAALVGKPAQEAPALRLAYSFKDTVFAEIVNVASLSQHPDIKTMYAPAIAQASRTGTSLHFIKGLFPQGPESRAMKFRAFSKLWTLPYLVRLGKMGLRVEELQIKGQQLDLKIATPPNEGTPLSGRITIQHKTAVSGTPAKSDNPLHDDAFFAVVSALEEGMNPAAKAPTERRQPAMGAFNSSGCGSAQGCARPA